MAALHSQRGGSASGVLITDKSHIQGGCEGDQSDTSDTNRMVKI